MKSGTRNLIIVAASIVVLGGAAAALALAGGGAAGSVSSSASSSKELISKKSSDVTAMAVRNKKGSYKLVPVVTPANSAAANLVNSGASSSSSPASTTTTYAVEGLSGVPTDSTAAEQVFQNGYSLVASQDLGEMEKLEEFGLKDPQATVEVSYRDGSTITYLIGSVSATDSSAYYMCKQNTNRVYVVTVDAGILEDKTYFVKKDILSISDSSGANDFTAITLSGKNYAQPVVLAKKDSKVELTSPVKAAADETNLTALETALATVTASSVEAVNPDAAALKKYGLDTPTAAAAFTVNKGSYKILAGAKKDDSYYVMLDKGSVVYLVASSGISAWAENSAFALRSKTLVTPAIETVKAIVLAKESESASVNIARTKDETKSTQDTPAYSYKVTGAGGKTLDYDTAYKTFYTKLIAPELLEESAAKPAGSPVYTVEYQYFDKSGKDTVQFYGAGDRRYLAVVNGETAGMVTAADIDAVYTAWQQLQSGASGS